MGYLQAINHSNESSSLGCYLLKLNIISGSNAGLSVWMKSGPNLSNRIEINLAELPTLLSVLYKLLTSGLSTVESKHGDSNVCYRLP